MNRVALALFGWLVPGGAYLLMRRYVQFALFAVVVWTAFGAGLWLEADWHGRRRRNSRASTRRARCSSARERS